MLAPSSSDDVFIISLVMVIVQLFLSPMLYFNHREGNRKEKTTLKFKKQKEKTENEKEHYRNRL